MLDQEIINRLEALILEEPLASRGDHDPTFARYWQSAFHHQDESPIPDAGSLTAYQVLARRALSMMRALCPDLAASFKNLTGSPDLMTVLQVTIFMDHNQFKGLLVNSSLSAILSPISTMTVLRLRHFSNR